MIVSVWNRRRDMQNILQNVDVGEDFIAEARIRGPCEILQSCLQTTFVIE